MSAKRCLFVAILLFDSAARAATVIHVDDDAPPGGDGATWATAFTYLQDALAVAEAGDEIRVAAGTYKPDRDEAGLITPGDRTATFRLVSGIGLYGGYRGCPGNDCTGGDPDERDIALHETILSGDLAGDDVQVPNPEGLLEEPTRAENSLHAVTASYTDATAVLDGLTISRGNANSPVWPDYCGGGVLVITGSPTVRHCTFLANSAAAGGGMGNIESSHPTVSDCVFVGNAAASSGGGMLNDYECNPIVVGCAFSGNVAQHSGGGMDNSSSSPVVLDCVFAENLAQFNGGGMYNSYGSNGMVIGCVFARNLARFDAVEMNDLPFRASSHAQFPKSQGGGGIFLSIDSNPFILDCVFSENWSGRNGGAIASMSTGSPALVNCEFIGNTAVWDGGAIDISSGEHPTVSKCMFSRNVAGFDGGAIHSRYSNLSIVDCAFHANLAGGSGGALLDNYNATAEGCAFVANTASVAGGAIRVLNDGTWRFSNCTFVANSANAGAAMACEFEYPAGEGTVSLSNSILRNGGSEIWTSGAWTITVAHSNVQGGYPGVGNIDADPLFVRNPSDGGDGWGDDPGTPDIDEGANDDYGDLHLSIGSPCIDAGDNTAVPADALDLDGDGDTAEPVPFDLDSYPRFVDDPRTPDTGVPDPANGLFEIVDMGADEFRPGDCLLDTGPGHDGDVDFPDYAGLEACLAGPDADPPSGCECFDLDADGHVDLADAAVFQRVFTGE